MSWVLAGMCALAVLWGAFSGNGSAVGAAAMEGAGAAVEFSLTVGALICLWSGVMEVLRQSGAAAALSRALRPALGRLFPGARRDEDTMEALCMNVSANLLGLGNAATPMGIRAARGMARLSDPGVAGDELCMLVVVNTASIQLLPTTVAAVRASAGAAAPFDIIPAVWLTSACALAAGIVAAKIFSAWTRS